MRSSVPEQTVLVTGATGTVGRALVGELLAAGAAVRAVTRDPLGARLPAGTEVVGGDPNAPETLTDVLSDVSSVFINPAAAGDYTGKLLALAREKGVGHAVLLSSSAIEDRAAQDADPLVFWHRLIEETVTGSGLRWTILRSAEFAANVLSQWADGIRTDGVVRGAAPGAASAPVHERDLAAVAARVLLDGAHAGATLTLTGPQSLTRTDMVGLIGRGIGRRLRFEEVGRDRAIQDLMARQYLPEGIAESVLRVIEESVGRSARVTATVQEVTGRPARTFAQWVADHAADLA